MSEGTALRFDLTGVTPDVFGALHELNGHAEQHARNAGVSPVLIELVRLRASQINGCAYCQDLHARQASSGGETELRLQELPNWRESTLFAAAERAALHLAESITRLRDGRVPEPDYDPARQFFDEDQLTGLVWVTSLINTYNRLAITMTPDG